MSSVRRKWCVRTTTGDVIASCESQMAAHIAALRLYREGRLFGVWLVEDHDAECDVLDIDPAIGRATKPCNCQRTFLAAEQR